jgi:4'-phosphopantetheinyl transferase
MPATADRSWAPGPCHPRLTEGTVHVWRADLEAVADDMHGLLSPEERVRARRLLSQRDRQRWIRARGVLRALLGRYLQNDPTTLRFAAGTHGKLELLDAAGGSAAASAPTSAKLPRLSFNLSHSGGLALYAFTKTGAVGIDVEVARRPINEIAIAARALGQAEARRLEALDPPVREREFLRAWVRHEAELKCVGTGIGRAATGTADPRPWMAELEVGPHAAGAVAVAEPSRELPVRHLDLSCWEWVPGPRRG